MQSPDCEPDDHDGDTSSLQPRPQHRRPPASGLDAAPTQDATVPPTIEVYEGADHGFLNPDRVGRFDPNAAEIAWPKVIDFLDGHLLAATHQRPQS